LIVIDIVRGYCSIKGTGNDNILLGVYNDATHLIAKLKNFITLYALFLALLTELEAED
jgi:hypothetical protein